MGFETADDAGVYRLDDERAVVVTADFITPVVDDARVFGRVAAANSLSDVYAMGGRPLTALNLLGFPPLEVPAAIIGEILAGAADICAEAGCAVAGGHSVRDAEVKFGLSVTGIVHPARILRNSTARPGDRLVLTKPLGTGALVAAARANALEPAEFAALVRSMTTLNLPGLALWDLGAHACTDVTGFGLGGHALEMATGADVRLMIEAARIPQLPRAAVLCHTGFTCGGTKANAGYGGHAVRVAEGVDDGMVGLVFDPQTSGGLLVAVPAERCEALCDGVLAAGALCAVIIGEVRPAMAGGPRVEVV